jgi:UDP-N-acetylglucosamine 2-epimerase (non-hydrolysing)
MKLILVAGARPNFMKVAPIIEAIRKHQQNSSRSIDFTLVNTGQHYDDEMSAFFFRDLGLPHPDVDLEVGSGTHAWQTAEIMKRFEVVCLERQPSHVLVVGDVNSTVACALVAAKLGIAVVHVEAGLRSFDRSMPEEINRVLTDSISDFLFTTEQSANENLAREGISKDKIYFVGNVMIDTLMRHREKARASKILVRLGLQDSSLINYGLLTLHRPANVEDQQTLHTLIEAVLGIAQRLPIVFPVHPRTAQRLRQSTLQQKLFWVSGESQIPRIRHGVICLAPLGYLDFLHLMENAKVVLTDSGGIQEETTILKVPCITLRHNTERPVTVALGTNRVIGSDRDAIVRESLQALIYDFDGLKPPPLWDGKAADRIVAILAAQA